MKDITISNTLDLPQTNDSKALASQTYNQADDKGLNKKAQGVDEDSQLVDEYYLTQPRKWR